MPRKSLSEMSTPFVLGSVKSSALSPTSSADDTRTIPSRPKTSKHPTINFFGVLLISPFLGLLVPTKYLHLAFYLSLCGDLGGSADHAVSPIQHLGGDLNPCCRGNLKINDKLDVVVYFDGNVGGFVPFIILSTRTALRPD